MGMNIKLAPPTSLFCSSDWTIQCTLVSLRFSVFITGPFTSQYVYILARLTQGFLYPLSGVQMSKYKVILLRHGEGEWNKENRFCSWVDQKLSADGVKEAQACGRLLREQGHTFDVVFTSLLSRSVHTAWLVLEAMRQEWVPVVKSWRLNERHYGALIGLNRAEMALNHGEQQVKVWRRSYNVTPPPIDQSHPYYEEIYNDRRYSTCDVSKDELPRAESLKQVLDRLLPYWDGTVGPEIRRGRSVLISAHGNSCRALLKHLEGRSN